MSLYLTYRFYITLGVIVFLLGGGYLYAPLFEVGRWALLLFALVILIDVWMLYGHCGIKAFRQCASRFSNGDDNIISIHVESSYLYSISIEIIDEIPFVFQKRDMIFRVHLRAREANNICYRLRPVCRGIYDFGYLRLFVSTTVGLVTRRYTCGEPFQIKVYPSFLMLRHYELLAMDNRLTDQGIKRIRRVGHHTEFEQIKDYVKDDDFRTINWKASARRNRLMVNVYQDERAQSVYGIIDKGRMMQQAFRGMTLLDYAINSTLVLAYIAMRKEDMAGIATFNERFDTFVPASKRQGQMQALQEALYNQQTDYGESDFSSLCVHLGRYLYKRSLLILYTNFSGLNSMYRQLPYLQQLGRRHCLLVVFFEDTELQSYLATSSQNTEDYYRHVIAEKFAYEKRLVVSTLKRHGIFSLLTTPENLSADVINKYLEIKATLF